MHITAEGLGGSQGLLNLWEMPSKPRAFRTGKMGCFQVSPFSSGIGRNLPLAQALMCWTLMGKCKPHHVSLPWIYYLCLDEFWPYKPCSWFGCKTPCWGHVLMFPLNYFSSTLWPDPLSSCFSSDFLARWWFFFSPRNWPPPSLSHFYQSEAIRTCLFL